MNERMMEIAGQLAALYRRHAEVNLRAWQADIDLKARELALTPSEGWPGKNQEARDLAREQTLAADEVRGKIIAQANKAHVDLTEIEGQIEGLEAERRALEWQIRARLVEALERNHIQGNHRGGSSPNNVAFDDVIDHATDQSAFGDDELPF